MSELKKQISEVLADLRQLAKDVEKTPEAFSQDVGATVRNAVGHIETVLSLHKAPPTITPAINPGPQSVPNPPADATALNTPAEATQNAPATTSAPTAKAATK